MAKDHNIDDLFKGAFDKFEAKPEANIWEELAGQASFDAQVKHTFGSFEAQPKAQIWEEISQQQAFDEQVRSSLSSLEVQPKPEVWAAVASHPLEAKMRSSFKDYEMEPAASNWDGIKRRIPFVLVLLRNNLPQLSRIAAVLVLGLLLSLSLSDINWNNSNTFANLPIGNKENACLNGGSSPIVLAENQAITSSTGSVPSTATAAKKEHTTPPNQISTSVAYTSIVTAKFVEIEPAHGLAAVKEGSTKDLLAKSMSTAPVLIKTTINTDVSTEEAKRIVFTANEIEGKESFIPINGIEMTLKKKNVKAQQQESSSLGNYTTAFGSNGIDVVDDFDDIIRNNKLVSRTDNFGTIQTLNYRGLYVIGSAQYGFNWLYNEALRNQLSEIVKTNYVIDFGGSAGVGIGFLLSPRIGLEAQWNYSRINQSYREHVPDGLFLDTKTKLTYSSFPVVIKFQLNRLKNNRRVPMTSSLAIGGQYRYLRKSIVQANVEVERDQFIEKEFGAVIGYDVNMHVSKNVFISIGGRASVGTDVDDFSNLSKDGRFNTEVGLRMAVNYKLKR